MNIFVPNYYKKFKCIAEKCKHNCCIGWEIDIDDDTYNYYLSLSDDFGKRIINHIMLDDGTAHFKLDENERCPFLKHNGLCEIITNIGNDKLCQICSDHPRFRNYIYDYVEMGIGLCCEAAAEIIISQKENICFEALNNNDISYHKTDFSVFRNNLFAILEDNRINIDIRLKNLLKIYGFNIFTVELSEWVSFFLDLEYMGDELKELLYKLRDKTSFDIVTDKYDFAFANLIKYFLYRYLPRSIYDKNEKEIVSFSVLNSLLINQLFKLYKNDGNTSLENLIEISRLFSTEIEYSEENTERILSKIAEFNV